MKINPIKRIFLYSTASLVVLIAAIASPLQVFAISEADLSTHEILYYRTDTNSCTPSSGDGVITASGVGGQGNKDYTGKDILVKAELDGLATNKSTYEAAGKESGVPWQMIAVLHLRETRFSRVNPGNDQGLYQDSAHIYGHYPAGPVSDAEFLRQSTNAGTFLKSKASQPDLLTKGEVGQVKDAFFGYNGRAGLYVDQAKKLGFTQGYDGSPYVVNKLDATRDPEKNLTTWGQIVRDGQGLVYPANKDYGAFVIYSSLAGITTSGCSSNQSGSLGTNVVKIAQQELALWDSGALKPGNSFQKYTYGASNDWCAWFVSWVLKTAGHPVDSSATPQWPAVKQFLDQSTSLGFIIHKAGEGYAPKPGDLAIYDGNGHINIVTGYDSNGKMITIGGNQAATPNGDFTTSKVSQVSGYGESATSYVEVK